MDSSSLGKKPNSMNVKILIIGDTSCGKTSTLMRFVHDKFEPVYKPTIAGEFSLKVGENDI